ncbi:putative F-box domain-containing protein [Seiridium unicorne]|uniref:F-box domain-containing protein n=1 Tax=Seiridium unicorne TaxID=138068 RepID=A0ABR2URL0_9PEZI
MPAMPALPDMASLRISDSPRLDSLPELVLSTIISHLNTAQSVARLSSTCKKLRILVESQGWRVFVCGRFGTLALPQRTEGNDWIGLARKLTWQSRAWDRRAFSVASLIPPDKEAPGNAQGHGGQGGRGGRAGRGGRGGRGRRAGRGGRGGRSRMQTYPPHILVDANSRIEGYVEEETVAWGAGEDVVVRWRETRHSSLTQEKWGTIEGANTGFRSGTDDVTAVSILNDSTQSPALLVGRASGYLQLSSISLNDFGRSIAWFQPQPSQVGTSIEQREIQHFDTNISKHTMAVATKDNLLFYPLPETWSTPDQGEYLVQPSESFDVRKIRNAEEFMLLQQVRFMESGDLALGMSSSPAPLRYLTRTPTETIMTNASKMHPSRRCTDTYIYGNGQPQTLRSILPVSRASVAGGSGNVALSSYDDGTIRLQDLRTSSAIDSIFQDHFEVTTPVGPLISYGMERFVVGSARDTILKIFDFRWSKSYYYTDALPCSKAPLGPTPKPLTWQSPPQGPERGSCLHLSDRPCRLHALARTNFYRPGCNIYLPVFRQPNSPIYSLAKASDTSPVMYAGLAGELVKIGLRDQETDARESYYMQSAGDGNRCGYGYQESFTSVVETSDGIALSDISKSSRVPAIYKQRGVFAKEFCRLDKTLT